MNFKIDKTLSASAAWRIEGKSTDNKSVLSQLETPQTLWRHFHGEIRLAQFVVDNYILDYFFLVWYSHFRHLFKYFKYARNNFDFDLPWQRLLNDWEQQTNCSIINWKLSAKARVWLL